MKITLKDIAQKANVSPSAVSLVLNNKPCRISPHKKEEIKAIAKELHYIPNQLARSLVSKETKTLGVIIPDIENLFFSSYVKQLEIACRDKGYFLLIASSNEQFSMDIELTEMFMAHSVDGMFITISDESYFHRNDLKKSLKKLPFPYVMVDRILDNFDCNQITYDHEKGAFEATQYLIEKGHRKIGCVTANSHYGNGKKRFNGYKKALLRYNIPYKKSFVFEGNYTVESGYNGTLALSDETTASFISSDMMALGFLKGLEEKNYIVPTNYSLVSYDNVSSPFLYNVELTSISQNINKLVEKSVDILLQEIKIGQGGGYKITTLNPSFIEGNTVLDIHNTKKI